MNARRAGAGARAALYALLGLAGSSFAAARPLEAEVGHAVAEPAPRSAAARVPIAARPSPGGTHAPSELRFRQGRFGEVVAYRPAGTPTGLVLFVSGDAGWTRNVASVARRLVDAGAIVVGIDVRRYRRELTRSHDDCQYFGGDFEELAHDVQLRLHLDEYLLPVVAGYSAGATYAYAVAMQSPRGTYAGVLGFGFCPDLELTRSVCESNLLRARPLKRHGGRGAQYGSWLQPAAQNRTPWIALHGEHDDVCPLEPLPAFVAGTGRARLVTLSEADHDFHGAMPWVDRFVDAYRELAAGADGPAQRTARAAAAPALPAGVPDVRDLPTVEVPASARAASAYAGTFAVLLTGDGGWAGIDQDLSAALAARGIPVVALNTLKYFWKKRDPEVAARDVARLIAHYRAAWHRDDALLIGYSFGADVLPFVYTRLSPDLRRHVRSVNLLGFGDAAEFEFHVADWLPGASGSHPTLPELGRMREARVLCVEGAGDGESVCGQATGAQRAVIGEGHHFGGQFDRLASTILAHAGFTPP